MSSSKDNKNFIKKIVKGFFSFFGYEIVRKNSFLDRYNEYIAELTESEKDEITKFEKICLLSKSNLWSIIQSINHIKNNNISGEIVECGIYNGNTLAFLGRTLDQFELEKKIWGYDTFEEGFLDETLSKYDTDFKKRKIKSLKEENIQTQFFSISDVISNINAHHKYDENKYILIKGDIIKSLDNEKYIPEKISFLRMDTDLYETTRKQLEVLYPKLSLGGVLHVDDYGMCPGVKTAVDEYFKDKKIWLHKVDMSCRYLIKDE